MTDMRKFRRFVDAYRIAVPPADVEAQLELRILEEKQRMQYERLTGKDMHLYARQELAEKMASLEREAYLAAKTSLVLRKLIEAYDFPVSEEELAAEAAAMAARRNTTVEALRSFFGEDLSMLRQELRERKAIAFAEARTPAWVFSDPPPNG